MGSGPRTGPERFWARWPARIALGVSLVVSSVAHCAVMPIDLPNRFEVQDVEGEAAIPVDMFEPDDTPPPEPLAGPEEVKSPTDEGKNSQAAAVASHADAGAPRDGSTDAPTDAARADASADAAGLDGAVALADAGPPSSGPRDPQAIVGAAGDIQVDAVLVMVAINAEVIRQDPAGPSLGALLRGIPQWDDFMHGTDIDPVKDVDWILISGPSLVNTSRDVVLVRYSASDAKVGRAMDVVAGRYAKGGAFDAGVGSMKAVRSFADGAERVVLQPRAHVLAVVPSSAAPKVARQLASASVPAHIRKGEAVYVRVVDPHHPMPELPATITEMRLRVVPVSRAAGEAQTRDGADVYIDGDTKTPEAARQAAADVTALVRRRNTILVSALTAGLFDNVEVASEGTVVKAHLFASRAQIATLINLVGGFIGVPAAASSEPAAPAGSR